jgi:transposase
MTGLSVAEFEALRERVAPRSAALVQQRRERADRQRAPGGGRTSPYDLTARLLMTLVWLRLYLPVEAIGVLFGVDKSTVSRHTRPILEILRDLGEDTLGWPSEAQALTPPAPATGPGPEPAGGGGEERAGPPGAGADAPPSGAAGAPDGGGSLDQVAILDATEQRVVRSQTYAVQKAHYSGKRKAHTRKTQLAVNAQGRIRHVSASVPGSTHDLTLLRQSGLLAVLPLDVTAVADTGYRGLQHDLPDHSVALPYRPKAHQKLLPEEKLHNHLIARLRVVVENTLAELKHFQCLRAVFRHAVTRYDAVVGAVVGLVNHRIDQRLAAAAA